MYRSRERERERETRRERGGRCGERGRTNGTQRTEIYVNTL